MNEDRSDEFFFALAQLLEDYEDVNPLLLAHAMGFMLNALVEAGPDAGKNSLAEVFFAVSLGMHANQEEDMEHEIAP